MYANSYGAIGHRIESEAELKTTIAKSFQQGGVHVIEVPMDYSDNDKILNKELKQKVQEVFKNL